MHYNFPLIPAEEGRIEGKLVRTEIYEMPPFTTERMIKEEGVTIKIPNLYSVSYHET